MDDQRRGLLLGAASFMLWGAFPLYWPLLEPASASEILAHRVLWALLVSLVMIVALHRTRALADIWRNPVTRTPMTAAGLLIGINWGTYIWGVNNHHVVETSLGYYINPLVTVLLGVVLLKERLRNAQWTALGIGVAAVLVLSWGLHRPPWISLVLAFSFGFYGLAKKRAAVGPVEGLAYEGLVLGPLALGYVAWLSATSQATAWNQGPGHVLLLTTTGLVTVLPLLCFAAAANRISLSTIGLLQYLAPTLQFVIGVFVFGEPMSVGRWVGFGLVWLALAVLTVDSLRVLRRNRMAARQHERRTAIVSETA